MGKIIITGTGRAGTTFLMQLLTRMGMDTGYTEKHIKDEPGLEKEFKMDGPRILKGPMFCDRAEELVDTLDIDCFIIPIRNLKDAAESRRKRGNKKGGLWGTTDPQKQELILLNKFYRVCLAASTKDIPVIFIHYPKMTKDPDYLYNKLKPILPGFYINFLEVFYKTIKT